ncbi:hypothetical protein ABKN59_005106 [Abortiporus biennis]
MFLAVPSSNSTQNFSYGSTTDIIRAPCPYSHPLIHRTVWKAGSNPIWSFNMFPSRLPSRPKRCFLLQATHLPYGLVKFYSMVLIGKREGKPG